MRLSKQDILDISAARDAHLIRTSPKTTETKVLLVGKTNKTARISIPFKTSDIAKAALKRHNKEINIILDPQI